DGRAALVAGDARRKRIGRRVGDVDDGVVDGVGRAVGGLPAGDDGAAHRGGRAVAAIDLLALEVDARPGCLAGVPATEDRRVVVSGGVLVTGVIIEQPVVVRPARRES